MRIVILKMSQIVETISGSIMILLFVYLHHMYDMNNIFKKQSQRILFILTGSVSIWIFSWVIRKISVNIYHSYLHETNQIDREFIVHLPFLYEHVDKEQINSVQSVSVV